MSSSLCLALPPTQVRSLNERMLLFLFNYDTRAMQGVYVCDGKAGMNIEPDAFKNYRKATTPKGESPFPAQIRFKLLRKCPTPLKESRWTHIPTALPPGRSGTKNYEYALTPEQAERLFEVFSK